METIDAILILVIIIFAYYLIAGGKCGVSVDGFAVDVASVVTQPNYGFYQFKGLTVCYGTSILPAINSTIIVALPVTYKNKESMFPVVSLADNTAAPSLTVSVIPITSSTIQIVSNGSIAAPVNWQVTGLTVDANNVVGTPVNGGWSAYGACDAATLTRLRTCTSPTPAYGGLNCIGDKTTSCLMPINDGWSVWSTPGCDPITGTITSTRTCNPKLSNNGIACIGDTTKTEECALTSNIASNYYTVGNITVCSGVVYTAANVNPTVVTLPFTYTSTSTMFPSVSMSSPFPTPAWGNSVVPTSTNKIAIVSNGSQESKFYVYWQVMGW